MGQQRLGLYERLLCRGAVPAQLLVQGFQCLDVSLEPSQLSLGETINVMDCARNRALPCPKKGEERGKRGGRGRSTKGARKCSSLRERAARVANVAVPDRSPLLFLRRRVRLRPQLL